MYETSIENYLVAGVEAKGGKCVKLIDQGRRGFPDRTVLMPGGKIIFVETKTADGHVQSWQNRYHVALRDLGFRVETLYSCLQVDRFLHTLADFTDEERRNNCCSCDKGDDCRCARCGHCNGCKNRPL